MKYDILYDKDDEPTSIYFSYPIELDGFNKISDKEYSIIGYDEFEIKEMFENYKRSYGLKNEMEYDMYFHDTNSYLPHLAYVLNNDILSYRYWFVLTSYDNKHNKYYQN